MPKSTQARKHAIGLAGEFLVAGELLRRGVAAAVTYGNAKRADVVAIHEGRAVRLEVKTTSEAKWVIGASLPDDPDQLWVLVHLPVEEAAPPQYFVLTGAELRELLRQDHDRYHERYRLKHGKEFEGSGVVSLKRKLLGEGRASEWQKVHCALGI